jgi:hypothetical protein
MGTGLNGMLARGAHHPVEHGIQPRPAFLHPDGTRELHRHSSCVDNSDATTNYKPSTEGARVSGRYIAGQRMRVVHEFDIPPDLFGMTLAGLIEVMPT